MSEKLTGRQYMQQLEHIADHDGVVALQATLQLNKTDANALECLQKVIVDYGHLTQGEMTAMLQEMIWWYRLLTAMHFTSKGDTVHD